MPNMTSQDVGYPFGEAGSAAPASLRMAGYAQGVGKSLGWGISNFQRDILTLVGWCEEKKGL